MRERHLYILIMIRTRQIIKRLSHDDLVKQGIIPDLTQIIAQSPTTTAVKEHPPFVNLSRPKTKFMFFGTLMDYIVRAGFRIHLKQTFTLGQDPNIGLIQTLEPGAMAKAVTDLNVYETSLDMTQIVLSSLKLSSMGGKSPFSQKSLREYVGTLNNIMAELSAKWIAYSKYLAGTIRYNMEYVHGNFSGHPDIVTDNCVLDIKTTSSFMRMSKESCLQVLAYYALMKPGTPNVEYVGFVLPLQGEITLYNVSAWDSSRYLQLLSSEANKMNVPPTIAAERDLMIIMEADDNVDIDMLTAQLRSVGLEDEHIIQALQGRDPIQLIGQNIAQKPVFCPGVKRIEGNTLPAMIGCHIAKGVNISKSLRSFTDALPGAPCQMFLGNPRTGKRSAKTAGQIPSAAQVIKDAGLQYFTHAAYVVNLCANQNDNGDYWAQRYLNEDLQFTAAMGGKGVVVHTGARKHLSEADALTIMEYMVRTALPYASETCPLLLETPCNEGTEVCGKIEELGNFFFRFTTEERKRLGVCVDTCHVFAAGYDPLAYLQHWEKHCQTTIRLVHFNDSQGACGSCIDRHQSPGHGLIGMEKMMAIARWCADRSIPMLTE